MKPFLKIENPGVCPPEAFTVLGVSLSDSGDENTIGKFGSGAKLALVTSMRHGLMPVVFTGSLRLEFLTRPQTVTGGSISKDFSRVVVKYGGTDPSTGASRSSTEDLGFVLDYGKQDWPGVDLALREFVSNSLDCCVREQGDWSGVKVEVVNANQVRAASGRTRVFVPLDAAVLEFFNSLGKWFLHFSEPDMLTREILPKANRNFADRKAAVIYRRGVRVREFEASETPSLFDYNLNSLELDESRRVDDWYVRYHAGRALAQADKAELVTFFDRLATGREPVWETSFDDMKPSSWWSDDKVATCTRVWNEAFVTAIGGKGVFADAAHVERLTKKGFSPVVVSENLLRAAEQHRVPTALTVLSEDELVGRSITAATPAIQAAVDFVWGLFTTVGMTNDKAKPEVRCFTAITDAEATLNGYQKGSTVFVNSALSGSGAGRQDFSERLLQVVVEELGHFVTGSCDFTRDFQSFAFQLAVKLAARW